MNRKQQIINKLNENQEPDAHKYTWKTIPLSLKKFWMNYFDQKKSVNSQIT